MPVGLQTPVQHEGRLVLLGRNQADDLLVEPARHGVSLDLGNKPVLIFLVDQVLRRVCSSVHGFNFSFLRLVSPIPGIVLFAFSLILSFPGNLYV